MSAGLKWVIAIVGLLVANVVAMGVLVAASSHDRPQVIPGYYERAVHYDDAIDQAAHNHRLGWQVTPTWDSYLAVDVRTRDGAPLRDARVTVTGAGRGAGARTLDTALVEHAPGSYRIALASAHRGLHDLTIVVEQGGDVFVTRATVEAP